MTYLRRQGRSMRLLLAALLVAVSGCTSLEERQAHVQGQIAKGRGGQ